jgi:hypothetical protein
LASSTSFSKFGLLTTAAATGTAAVAGPAGHFQRLWPNRPQGPHLRCLATGLSIALAGLFGDNMVDEKMNFVVAWCEDVTNERSSFRRNGSLELTTEALSIFYRTFFNQILATSYLVRILQHIKKGDSETTFALSYSRLSLLKQQLISQMGYHDTISVNLNTA